MVAVEQNFRRCSTFRFCKDLGVTNLDPKVSYVITGNSVDEVLKKSIEHAKAARADMLKAGSSPAQMTEMEKMICSKITNEM